MGVLEDANSPDIHIMPCGLTAYNTTIHFKARILVSSLTFFTVIQERLGRTTSRLRLQSHLCETPAGASAASTGTRSDSLSPGRMLLNGEVSEIVLQAWNLHRIGLIVIALRILTLLYSFFVQHDLGKHH